MNMWKLPIWFEINSQKAKKNNKCVYGHMLEKIRVGRPEIIFFQILFFITKLMLDGIYHAFLHLKSDI